MPFATISDICTGKASLRKCSGETLYRLSRTLGVTMEALLVDAMEHRSSFEVFKSNVCHRVHDLGDLDFVITILETDEIRRLHNKRWNEVPPVSRSFIEAALAHDDLEALYRQSCESEQQSQDILLDFDQQYPNALKTENIDSVLEQARLKKQGQ